MGFIDLHGHYAWGIDDGIENEINARHALKKAKMQGISEIVATPHIICGKTTHDEVAYMFSRIKELKKISYEYGISIHSGCELMLNENITQTMDENLFIPIEGTKYILCEYDVRKMNSDFVDVFDSYIQEIVYRGYKPIVAHVERYFHEDIDLDYVRYLIELGCVIQVNTTSLLGEGGSIYHRNAMKLLNEQLVHVISTDTHRATGVRSPNMDECYEYLYNQGYQKKYIELLQYDNAKRILNDMPVVFPKFKNKTFVTKMIRSIVS